VSSTLIPAKSLRYWEVAIYVIAIFNLRLRGELMKRINLTAFIAARKLVLKFILLCLFFAGLAVAASAQQNTGPCTINGRSYNSCTRSPNGDCVVVPGQIYGKCDMQTPAKCAEGGPLIIKLNSAGTYYERSIGYTYLNDNLKCRGVDIGFFGAASDVTWGLHMDPKFLKSITGSFSEMADTFLALASSQLVTLNVAEFRELADTGKLSITDGRYVAYLTNPVDIDSELVRREQMIVENDLVQTGIYRNAIVTNINTRIKYNLDGVYFGATMQAMKEVRNNMRVMFPNAEFDYGNFYNRVAVGNILAKQHRK
jgi:hypothetical protein